MYIFYEIGSIPNMSKEDVKMFKHKRNVKF